VGEASRWLDSDSISRFRKGLRILALRALGDADLAEDVAQEVLARAIVAAEDGRLTPDDNVGAYLQGIARHVISDVWRQQKRVAASESVLDLPAVPASALTALVSDEERSRIRDAMARLSVGDREVLRLSFFEDLNSTQIADLLGQPSSRIRKRKSRALQRLREALARESHTSNKPSD